MGMTAVSPIREVFVLFITTGFYIKMRKGTKYLIGVNLGWLTCQCSICIKQLISGGKKICELRMTSFDTKSLKLIGLSLQLLLLGLLGTSWSVFGFHPCPLSMFNQAVRGMILKQISDQHTSPLKNFLYDSETQKKNHCSLTDLAACFLSDLIPSYFLSISYLFLLLYIS